MNLVILSLVFVVIFHSSKAINDEKYYLFMKNGHLLKLII